MSEVLIWAENVTKSFGERTVIKDLSFVVREGEITGLLGPNGSGKTTAIRLLNGVIRADRGAMRVAGYDPGKNGELVRQNSGVLTESADFYRHLSGLDNLRFFGRLYGVVDDDRCRELLETFGLGEHQHKKVGTYSTGMRKRLGLAKALLHRPKLLFLDEPTNGLDPEGVRHVLGYIKELNQKFGTTILVCSHLLNQMEAICDRYLFIDQGRLIEHGTLSDLKKRYRHGMYLEVETDRLPSEQDLGEIQIEGVGPGTIGAHRIRISVDGVDDIPPLLRSLTQSVAVYRAQVEDQDLESLYFMIRERVAS